MPRPARRRSLTPLGETEMEVLQHVWALGHATVADVHARILEERSVAYTTVMTVMKKLAEKGFLQYEPDGPSYVYSAARSPDTVRGELLRDVLEKVFQGSPTALVQSLVEDEQLTADERTAIVELLAELDRQGGQG
ncbi:MAG: BlaI/MecI/CopY family transcriptional regulator [Gemmatimonadota bacterium]